MAYSEIDLAEISARCHRYGLPSRLTWTLHLCLEYQFSIAFGEYHHVREVLPHLVQYPIWAVVVCDAMYLRVMTAVLAR